MNRRSFLKASLATTAISLCSAPALVKAAGKKYDKHIPIGLELYSLRDVINHETFPKFLKWVAETGFEVVEFAGYHVRCWMIMESRRLALISGLIRSRETISRRPPILRMKLVSNILSFPAVLKVEFAKA